MTMKALNLAVLAVIGSQAVAGAALASTITDDFSGATLDSSWGVYGGSPDYSGSTGSNGLTINYSSTSAAPTGVNAGVFSTFSFDGNYTVQTVQDITGLPNVTSSTFVNGGAYVYHGNYANFIGPWNQINGPVTQGAIFENGVFIAGQNFNLSSEVNTLKQQRVGDTIFESVAPLGSTDFTPLFSATSPNFLGPTGVNLGLFVQGTVPVPAATIVYKSISVTYGDDPSLPTTISNAVGGTADHPAALSGSSIQEITGDIGGPTPADFFRFHWNGGSFGSVASLVGADPGSTFKFKLLGGVDYTTILDQSNLFIGNISFDNLAAGNYAIGLSAGSSPDPTYYINFQTPISGVPEPSTWALMLIGFGGLGALVRGRRRTGVA